MKVEKAKIDIEDVSEKVVELRTLVSKIGKVKDLKDEEIREKLIDSKRWETKLDLLKDSKTKLKKELINVDFEAKNEKVENLEKDIRLLWILYEGKLKSLLWLIKRNVCTRYQNLLKNCLCIQNPFPASQGKTYSNFLKKWKKLLQQIKLKRRLRLRF